MKKIIFIAILLSGIVFGADVNRLDVFAKYDGKSVRLKWIPKNYSSKNVYEVYRQTKEGNRILLSTVKSAAYEQLKKDGYTEDDLMFIYPLKVIKNQVEAYVASKQMGGFRILKMMRDNKFSKDIGQYIADKSIEKNTKYTYEVVLFQDTKKVSSRSIKVDTSRKSMLDGVFFVRAKNKSSGVGLKWGSGNSYSFYNIYRKKQSEKNFKRLNNKSLYISPSYAKKAKEFYEDKSLKKGESATYHIRKIDMFAQEGNPSYEVQGMRLAVKEMPNVKNLFVKNSDKKITIRWKKSSDVEGYNIYRSTNYDGGYIKLNKKLIEKEVFFDKTFKADQNYYYYVTSISKLGESKPSVKMLSYARDVTPPSFPENLVFDVKAGSVHLSWDAVKEKDLLGYRIYMSMDKNATQWSRVTKKGVSSTSYAHKRPKKLSRNFYYYKVQAVDKAFNESASSNIVKVKLPDVTAPKQPKITKFVSYPDKIILEWGKNLVYDFEHYNVYRKDGKKLNNEPLIRNHFIDKNPLIGVNEYVVTAVDTSGNESVKTKSIKINLEDIIPVKIENFKVIKSKNGVNISFTCKDKDYKGFEVFRSSGNDKNYYNISSYQTGKSFTDIKVDQQTVYFYKIKAYDMMGNRTQSDVLSTIK